jgi:hypothetical protein
VEKCFRFNQGLGPKKSMAVVAMGRGGVMYVRQGSAKEREVRVGV